jgi:hypothetical protein
LRERSRRWREELLPRAETISIRPSFFKPHLKAVVTTIVLYRVNYRLRSREVMRFPLAITFDISLAPTGPSSFSDKSQRTSETFLLLRAFRMILPVILLAASVG